MTLHVICLLALAVAMEIAREVCFKIAADRAPVAKKTGYLIGLFGAPLIWLGFTCWGIEIVTWVMVLAQLPLSIAFPIMSLSYCGMIVASKYVLRETVSAKKWVGVFLITAGVMVIGAHGA